MNTGLKRKLSSVIANESIVKNIGNVKYKNFCNTTINHNKNKKNKNKILNDSNSDKEEHANKRQKKTSNRKTHYNEKMEPIRLSSSCNHLLSGFVSTGKIAMDLGSLPKRIREVVWNTYNGETYSSKCYVPWCSNIINVFNYQVGHDIPESKGGTYDIGNLRPICSNCNLSMGNKWTIQEWGKLVNRGREQNPNLQTENTPQEHLLKENNTKTELLAINPETTSRITFITLLLLAVNFMII